MTDRLFVYGTLRRSTEGTDHPLLRPECTYLCAGYVRGILYDLGPYPAVVSSEVPRDRVRGDVYRMHVPERVLRRLDAYEGDLYVRRTRDVETKEGERFSAWIYLVEELPDSAERVTSGDYHR